LTDTRNENSRFHAGCFRPYVFAVYSSESEACEGLISSLRISNYVDGGSEAGLRKASALHNEWYVANGVNENSQNVVPIFDYDDSTDSVVKNAERAATPHFNATVSRDASEQQGDEGWTNVISA